MRAQAKGITCERRDDGNVTDRLAAWTPAGTTKRTGYKENTRLPPPASRQECGCTALGYSRHTGAPWAHRLRPRVKGVTTTMVTLLPLTDTNHTTTMVTSLLALTDTSCTTIHRKECRRNCTTHNFFQLSHGRVKRTSPLIVQDTVDTPSHTYPPGVPKAGSNTGCADREGNNPSTSKVMA